MYAAIALELIGSVYDSRNSRPRRGFKRPAGIEPGDCGLCAIGLWIEQDRTQHLDEQLDLRCGRLIKTEAELYRLPGGDRHKESICGGDRQRGRDVGRRGGACL